MEKNVAWRSSYFDRILKFLAPSVKLVLYKFCRMWLLRRNVCEIESRRREYHQSLSVTKFQDLGLESFQLFLNYVHNFNFTPHNFLHNSPKLNDFFNSTMKVELYFQLFPLMYTVLKDSFDRLVLWYSFEVEFDVLYVWSTVHSYYIRIYTVWEIEFPGFRYNEFFISDVALFLIIVYYRWRPLGLIPTRWNWSWGWKWP